MQATSADVRPVEAIGAAVSDVPFGFGPTGRGGGSGGRSGSGGSGGSGGGPGGGGPGDDGPDESAGDPFGGLFGGGGMSPDLAGKIPLFAELEKLMSWRGGPVNWDLAAQIAVRTAAEGDRPLIGVAPDEAAAAVRLADVWLDPVTVLPAGANRAEDWTRVRWIEATLPVWAQLCDPVAARVVEAMSGALPEEVRSLAGPMAGIMGQLGGLVFGAQVGQAIGQLAREVVGSTDIGLPLGPACLAALLPANVAAFGAGLEIPIEEVRLYLALREAAHHRLFAHVPWLRRHLFDAVAAYATGIRIDGDAIGQAMGQLDPMSMDPAALQQMLGGGLFEPQTTDEQRAALQRLETALALVEGWVDEVVDEAAREHLPASAALRETMRRRRAGGGPAEQTFATLVGLELRPRRLREAAALWRALAAATGADGRDAVWAHPGLLPTPADLDDPARYVAERAAPLADSDISAELAGLDEELRRLSAGPDAAPGGRPGGDPPEASGPPEPPSDGDHDADGRDTRPTP